MTRRRFYLAPAVIDSARRRRRGHGIAPVAARALALLACLVVLGFVAGCLYGRWLTCC